MRGSESKLIFHSEADFGIAIEHRFGGVKFQNPLIETKQIEIPLRIDSGSKVTSLRTIACHNLILRAIFIEGKLGVVGEGILFGRGESQNRQSAEAFGIVRNR